jgi:transposase InsO family protein
MAWREVSIMDLRKEFVSLANQAGANIRELCHRFQISPTTAYKWLERYRNDSQESFQDRSRRPHHCPLRCEAAMEQQALAVRQQHPAWGARKIRARLQTLGVGEVPAVSTVHAILKRHQRIASAESAKHKAWQRFEHEAPNQLWQMDFKGHFALASGQRCHPLTILDDHSRYSLCMQACRNEQGEMVQQRLIETFRRYGLPERMLMDNGSPWGSSDWQQPYTPLTVWLLRLGIAVCHGGPYHPQTQGKGERFHRTLKAELLQSCVYADFDEIQQRFDQWRPIYNQQRPHEALAMAVPASRYQVSPRRFPEVLPAIEYAPGDVVRKVQATGRVSFRNWEIRLSKAFRGYAVGLRPTLQDGVWQVYFCTHRIAEFDLKKARS